MFHECETKGFFDFQHDTDIMKIKHMLSIALGDEKSGQQLMTLPKQTIEWSTIYKLHYDALHQLVEAFLRFDNVKSNNHQCLFAYLCEKHSELDLDWRFFEKIRTKRNGIQYYGTPTTQQDWKEIETQTKLYITTFKKLVEQKLEKQP